MGAFQKTHGEHECRTNLQLPRFPCLIHGGGQKLQHVTPYLGGPGHGRPCWPGGKGAAASSTHVNL